MLFNQTSILSLSRFYHNQEELPCWVAGRFFDKDSQHFFLKSQAQSLLCEKNLIKTSIQPASWIAVELLSYKKSCYQTGKYLILNAPQADFVEKEHSFQRKGGVLQEWRRFLKTVEGFCLKKGLAYSSTPHLVKCPGTEPYLKFLKTSFKKTYLATSPEMHLKRLLCQDWTDFFEIKTCYREEEISPHHQVEFTLLEWYRAFYSSKELLRETYELFLFLQERGFCEVLPYKVFTVAELFKKYLGFSLTPKSSKQDLMCLIKKHKLSLSLNSLRLNLESGNPFPKAGQSYTTSQPYTNHPVIEGQSHTHSKEGSHSTVGSHSRAKACPRENGGGNLQKISFEDLFFLLFLNKIEPKLDKQTPVFICDYPPQLRAFSQINQEGWADRFELYWQGLELANAFYEVIDPLQQKKLFQKHLSQRKDTAPLDTELLKDMKMAMPPVSGVALGLDRLFLALLKKQDLKQTRLFPL